MQNFDSLPDSALPSGWTSTQNRQSGTNDFLTLPSVPHSQPNAVISTNATIEQILVTGSFDFSGFLPKELQFFVRRSASHLAGVVVEASIDSGQAFPFQIGDTLRNPNPGNYVFYSFMLPSELANEQAVRFRWRIIPVIGGTTGTFRIDDLAVSVLLQHDLTLDRVFFLPEFASEFDSVRAIAMVGNIGQQGAGMFTVNVYSDRNHDSIPQVNELIGNGTNLSPLNVGDSVAIAIPIGTFLPGGIPVISEVEYPQDQNLQNNRCYAQLDVGYHRGSVAINEIMYAPTGTEPEWVELFNTRVDSILVQGWLVSDNIIASKRTLTTLPVTIPPSGYVILTRDSAAFMDIHPDIQCRVLAVTGFPTLNNTGDAVVLYDERIATMDSTAYLPNWGGNTNGYSLERVDPLGSPTEAANWGTSFSSQRSTPGQRNSLARKDFDLLVDTLLLSPVKPVHGDSIIATVKVRNIGFQAAQSFELQLFNDADIDSIPQPSELIDSVPVTGLGELDSLSFSFQPFWPTQNKQNFIAEIYFPPDEDTLNNRAVVAKEVGYRQGSLVVNEIMYNPVGEPEWVELLNATGGTVDIGDWKVSNRSVSNRYMITDSMREVNPFGYVLVTKDTALVANRYGSLSGTVLQVSALPTFLFSNSGDAVVVFDNQDRQIDSVKYSPGWGGNGDGSLERIDALSPSNDSLNWMLSTDSLGGTPGRENSVAALDHDLRLMGRSAIAVPPESSVPLEVTVKNIGRLASGTFDIAFYDDANRDSVAVAGELAVRVHVQQSILRGDTLDVSGQWMDASPGVHPMISILEDPLDLRTANNTIFFDVKVGYGTGAAVVNEIMYEPFDGEAEYVELVNVSSSNINLSGWTIEDRPAATGNVNQFTLSKAQQMLPGNGYVVVASDSSVFSRFAYLDTMHLVIVVNQTNLGLNNDGDAIVIRDATKSVIDSVSYVPAWHNPSITDRQGRSLEKISPRLASNDLRSWSTCAFGIGGTPGAKNSIYATAPANSATVSCSPNPFSPDGDGFEDFSIVHYTLPVNVATVRVRIFDAVGRLVRNLVNNEPSGVTRDVAWDGRDDDKRRARVGVYVVLVQGANESGGDVYSAKGVVVLAAKM